MPELPLETERIYIHFLRLLWELNKVMHVERLSQWPAHWTCSLNNGLMTSRQGEGFVGRGNCTYHSLALQSLMSEGTPASLPPWAHRCTEGCAFQFLLLTGPRTISAVLQFWLFVILFPLPWCLISFCQPKERLLTLWRSKSSTFSVKAFPNWDPRTKLYSLLCHVSVPWSLTSLWQHAGLQLLVPLD